MVGNGNSRQLAVRYYSDTSKFPGGFPTSTAGSEGVFYIDTSTDTHYLWDKTTQTYEKTGDKTFEPRITNLEDKNETKQLFETISGTTSGSVTTYTNITISQDNWANQNNAFAVETEAGRPSQKTLFTSTGVPITSSINALGEYALSGTPTATDYCIVWLVTGKQVDFATAQIPENKIIEEYDYDSPFVRDTTNQQILPETIGDDLNMKNGNLLNIGYVDFHLLAGASIQEGRLMWDEDAGTLVLGMPGGNVKLQIGQEMIIPRKVKNQSGVDIKNGDLIYISGGDGTNAYITLATNNVRGKADATLAMATEDIDNNSFGYCTRFGLVRGEVAQPIDTSAGVAGDKLYLGENGTFITTKPVSTTGDFRRVVCVGNIFRSNATEGKILVSIEVDKLQTLLDITKEPTGFDEPQNVTITGDTSTRKVTLTGSFTSYYRNIPDETIINGWVSPEHGTDTSKQYFLRYDGSTIEWTDVSTIDTNTFYTYVQIAYTFYITDPATPANNGWAYLRECHGFMNHNVHQEFHDTVGTYKLSGGIFSAGSYVLNSIKTADRRPLIEETQIKDEDNISTLDELATESYTTYYLDGANGDPKFELGSTDLIKYTGSTAQWNEFTGGAWTLSNVSTAHYFKTFVVALPMAEDARSKALRYISIQAQQTSSTLSQIQAVRFQDVDKSTLASLATEYCAIMEVIWRQIGGDWQMIEANPINLSRANSTITGTTGIISVSHDSTLTGSGVPGDPIGIDVNNANSWTATQTFTQANIGSNTEIKESSGDTVIENTSATNDIIHKLGDALGVTNYKVQDSAGVDLLNIESLSGETQIGKTGIDSVFELKDSSGVVQVKLNSVGNSNIDSGDLLVDGVQTDGITERNSGVGVTIEGVLVKDNKVTAETLESTIAIGTAPLTITSTTLVSNLNADLLDGQEGSYYLDSANHTGTQTASTISDFDTEVSNNASVSSNTSKVTESTTVSDTNTVDLTLATYDITADVKYQNSSTINLSDDVSGLKADLNSTLKTNYDSAYSHISTDGSSHTYIDQSVVSGATPTFTGTNITGVPASSILAGTFGTGAYVFDGSVNIDDSDSATLLNMTGSGVGTVRNLITMNTVDSRGSGIMIDQGTAEWFVGTNYNVGSAGYFQIGYDASGGQAENSANSKFNIRTNGNIYVSSGLGTTGSTSGHNALYVDTSTYQVVRFTCGAYYKENYNRNFEDYEKIYEVRTCIFDEKKEGGSSDVIGIIADELFGKFDDLINWTELSLEDEVDLANLQYISSDGVYNYYKDRDILYREDEFEDQFRAESYDRAGFIPILIKTIQEQKKKQDFLESRIQALEEQW